MATSRFLLPVVSKWALLAVLPISLVAPSQAEAAQRPAAKLFKIGSRSLEGRPKMICVIEGKWADGEYFRFEAWDACGKMHVRAVSYADYKDAPSLGSDDQYGVSDIPRNAEVLEVSNDFSTTLVFRDKSIRMLPLDGAGKRHLTAAELRSLILNEASARQLFGEHEELFVEAARNAALKRDLIALGYRRAQLDRFDRLMHDADFFAAERHALGPNKRPEDVWQAFFELNPWIFGHGLSYVFATALDDRRLEQVVQGASVAGAGKRVDAVMKTQARVNSLCFVEIKRHDTSLLTGSTGYRSGAFAPSTELGGGIAQVQATVQAAIERLGHRIEPADIHGNPTGETLFNFDPRAYLVIGSLAEFGTQHGTNEAKFRSFELFRRNIRRPEIITFDELLHRARFIVEHESTVVEADTPDDDVPF